MRLTLRTLLAYLDDVLEPEHTREIGQKVNESSYASMLTSRIREVMRRRRLLAPDLTGPQMGIDPNTVAEYLDSTLSPEGVADVERICLDSDVHLAEVAACHQVLTLVLGEPVDVPQRTRERMYALGPTRAPETKAGANAAKPLAAGSSNGKPHAPTHAAAPASTAQAEFDTTLPDYLRPAPLWKRFAPLALGLLIAGAWAAMVYFDPTYQDKLAGPDESQTAAQVASSSSDATSRESTSSEPSGADSDTAQTSDSAPAAANGSDVAAVAARDRSIALLNLPMPAAVPPPAVVTAPSDAAAGSDPTRSASGLTKIPMPPPTTALPLTKVEAPVEEPPPAAVPVQQMNPAPETIYTSRTGLLASQSDLGWMVMPRRSMLRAGELLATPHPFTAILEVSALDLTIELLPGTALELVGSTKDEALVLALHRGRVSFKRSSAEDAESLPIGLMIAGEKCRLTLNAPKALCGIEINPREPESFEMDLGQDRYQGTLAVVDGEVHFQGELAGDATIPPQTFASISVKDRKLPEMPFRQSPLVVIPDWIDPNKPRMSITERNYATRFEKEIDPELPLNETIPTFVASTVPTMSSFAIKTLATMEQYTDLIAAMARTEFEDSRLAAITGLRQWLGQDPANKDRLRVVLSENFSPDHVDPIYRLLWGYDEKDARNPATSAILVEWLKHDNVVIRQLAFYHVYRLTGQRYDYKPINPPAQRNAAVERWYMHLERRKGALLD